QIFSYPSTFIIPCSIFDIGLLVKNIKNNLALMGCVARYRRTAVRLYTPLNPLLLEGKLEFPIRLN
ncbi:MAG: hypothetical protein NUV74_11930, partial [Candidatus Brocadiaceae bacterium]|nr:hypothetical protein [Candidatus Brocadiaceae bacterium]